jgi:hypothetical protein
MWKALLSKFSWIPVSLLARRVHVNVKLEVVNRPQISSSAHDSPAHA